MTIREKGIYNVKTEFMSIEISSAILCMRNVQVQAQVQEFNFVTSSYS